MNSISCFIVDDEDSTTLLADLIVNNPRLRLNGKASSSISALNFLLSGACPDVLFLNIDLAADFNQTLRDYIVQHQVWVVVTSLHKDHAFQAFESGFFDYLLKPLTPERFLKTIGRIMNVMKSSNERNCFYIQGETKGKIVKIIYDDVKFIEANLNYMIIFTDKGEYTTYQTLKTIEQKLPAHKFIRVHKSFIVNESRISSVNHDCIILNDKSIIKLGPNYRENLFSKLLPGF